MAKQPRVVNILVLVLGLSDIFCFHLLHRKRKLENEKFDPCAYACVKAVFTVE